MKNTKLRNQCADMVRYIRRRNPYFGAIFYHRRGEVEQDIVCYNQEYWTLEDFNKEAQSHGYSSSNCFFRAEQTEDCGGYPEDTTITLYTYRKMNDTEYFDYLSSLLLPTQHQMDEYKQYLMLKNKYEGEV